MTDTKKTTIQITCECGKKYRCRSQRIGKTVRCKSCGNSIRVTELMGVKPAWSSDETLRFQEDTMPGGRFGLTIVNWSSTWGIALLSIVLIAGVFQSTLDGPAFMTMFVALLVTIVVAGLVIRIAAPTHLKKYVAAGLITYEMIAIVRLIYGMNVGMSRFDNLKAMMVVGPIAVCVAAFISLDGAGSNNRGSSFCGGWSGGGCSGGDSGEGGGAGAGCGGGGCGGCGGGGD
ncbi:MAG: hypothetical protein ACI8P0_000999 [Planctomycetaceae bacterium]